VQEPDKFSVNTHHIKKKDSINHFKLENAELNKQDNQETEQNNQEKEIVNQKEWGSTNAMQSIMDDILNYKSNDVNESQENLNLPKVVSNIVNDEKEKITKNNSYPQQVKEKQESEATQGELTSKLSKFKVKPNIKPKEE